MGPVSQFKNQDARSTVVDAIDKLTLKQMPFVEAARALGRLDRRILLSQFLPGVWTPVIVVTILQVGEMVVAESSLTFFRIDVTPTIPSWGVVIADGRSYVGIAW